MPIQKEMTETRVGHWTKSFARLHFRFGYVEAGAWRFPAITLDWPFVDLASCEAAAKPPLELLSRDAKAVLVPMPLGPSNPDLPKLKRVAGTLRYVPDTKVNYYLDLPGTFAEYLKSLPAKARHEMVRKVRKFAALAGCNDIDIREYRTCAEVEEFQRAAHVVSEKTYQFRLLKLGIPDTPEFRSELMELAAAGTLRGYVLYLRQRPVAFGYCRVHHGVLDYVQTGYDPEMNDISPGVVLLYGLLRCVFSEARFSRLDFGYGEAQWKRVYGSGSVRYAVAYHFRATPLNAFLLVAHICATGFSDFTGAALARLGLKERFKAFLRKGAAPGKQPAPAQEAQ